jgi:pyridoxamine 5'-phosphate oxidase
MVRLQGTNGAGSTGDEPSPGAPLPHADPRAVRRSYRSGELTEAELAPSWLEQLQAWYDQAAADDRIPEPNAIQLATVDADGRPDLRTVLARGFDADGLVFYTNYESAKGRQLAIRPAAAVVFSWLPLERQVRLRGEVRRVSREETEAYFAGRPRGSQLAAWASPQSRTLTGRAELDGLLAQATGRFEAGPISAPPDWGGYRVIPSEVEFWQGREFRLHDRLRFVRTGSERWLVQRLAP